MKGKDSIFLTVTRQHFIFTLSVTVCTWQTVYNTTPSAHRQLKVLPINWGILILLSYQHTLQLFEDLLLSRHLHTYHLPTYMLCRSFQTEEGNLQVFNLSYLKALGPDPV